MNYIRITKENIDREHICCAMSGKQSIAKKEWLRQRFEEGLVFYRSEERGKCFIEYNPFNYRLFIYFLCLLQDSLKVYQRQITLILYSPQPTIIEILKKFHFNEKSPKSPSVLGKIKPRYVIYKNS